VFTALHFIRLYFQVFESKNNENLYPGPLRGGTSYQSSSLGEGGEDKLEQPFLVLANLVKAQLTSSENFFKHKFKHMQNQ